MSPPVKCSRGASQEPKIESLACRENGLPDGRLLQGSCITKWSGQTCEQIQLGEEIQDTNYYSVEANPANSEGKR